MKLRPTHASTFDLVSRGILKNQAMLVRAQERIATGKRILRPSDDPQGTGRALSMRRQLAELGRYRTAVDGALPVMQTASTALEGASDALAHVRALLVQGMNGTLSAEDRANLGVSVGMLFDQLLGVANARFGDRYVFGGNRSQQPPYEQGPSGVRYTGDPAAPSVAIGHGARSPIGLPGSQIFHLDALESVELVGTTGLTLGTSANQGSGYARIEVRHDATTGVPGSGLGLFAGGANDTLLGDRVLVVDAAEGTVRLGDGPAVVLPDPSSPEAAHLVVRDEHGAEVHLDASAYDGTSSSATLSGEGSISLDGSPFTPLDLSAEDLRLVGADSGVVLHVDATGVRRAGAELVAFQGHSSVFDVVRAIADDLLDPGELEQSELLERLHVHLGELDRLHGRVLEGVGVLGSRQSRLLDTRERLAGVELQLESLLSNVEDVDITEVVLEAGRAEQVLQLVQMAGARLIQSSLLNFLR